MFVLTVTEGLSIFDVYDPQQILGKRSNVLVNKPVRKCSLELSRILLSVNPTVAEGQLFSLSITKDFSTSAGLFAIIPLSEGKALFFQDTTEMDVFIRTNPFSHSKVAILQLSDVGRIEFISRFSQSLLNKEAVELIGEPIMRFVCNDDLPHFCRKMIEIRKLGVANFSVKMIRSGKTEAEGSIVELEILGRVFNGVLFLVLMEQSACASMLPVATTDTRYSSNTGSLMNVFKTGVNCALFKMLQSMLCSLLGTKSSVSQCQSEPMVKILFGMLSRIRGEVVQCGRKMAWGFFMSSFVAVGKKYTYTFSEQLQNVAMYTEYLCVY